MKNENGENDNGMYTKKLASTERRKKRNLYVEREYMKKKKKYRDSSQINDSSLLPPNLPDVFE